MCSIFMMRTRWPWFWFFFSSRRRHTRFSRDWSSDVCSSDLKESGEELFVAPDRVYLNYEEMIAKESALPEGERMDFLTIVTPNFLHFGPAKLALRSEERRVGKARRSA